MSSNELMEIVYKYMMEANELEHPEWNFDEIFIKTNEDMYEVYTHLKGERIYATGSR